MNGAQSRSARTKTVLVFPRSLRGCKVGLAIQGVSENLNSPFRLSRQGTPKPIMNPIAELPTCNTCLRLRRIRIDELAVPDTEESPDSRSSSLKCQHGPKEIDSL